MSTKNNAHWYPRHYKDYQNDTSHLSMLEHGAYTLLLDLYYLTGKALLADGIALARQVRCLLPEEQHAMESVLHQFFELEEDGWHNRRADEELAKRAELLEKKRKAAHVGNQLRWQSDRTSDRTSDPMGDLISDPHTHTHTHTQEQPQAKRTRRAAAPADGDAAASGSAVWQAYSAAYARRYGVDPVRNARTNALCSQLVKRLGSEAPDVAAFFVGHSKQFYVLKGHSLTLLIADAETLRTEWATGRRLTSTGARQADRTQATGQAFGALIAEQGGES